MDTVPEDIVKVIFSFLDFKSNNALSTTALRYYNLSKYYISSIPRWGRVIEIARKYKHIGVINLSNTRVEDVGMLGNVHALDLSHTITHNAKILVG